MENAGWLWWLMDVLFVAILAGGLIWGTMHWRRRRDARAQAEGTRRLYREEAAEEHREEVPGARR